VILLVVRGYRGYVWMLSGCVSRNGVAASGEARWKLVRPLHDKLQGVACCQKLPSPSFARFSSGLWVLVDPCLGTPDFAAAALPWRELR